MQKAKAIYKHFNENGEIVFYVNKPYVCAKSALNSYFVTNKCVCFCLPFQSFGTYTLFNDKPLTPEIAFPSLALFSLFDRYLFVFPAGLATATTGYVSIKRLEHFLLNADSCKLLCDDEGAVETSEMVGDSEKVCNWM